VSCQEHNPGGILCFAKALGIGFCSKGVLGGYVAVPLRLPDGTVAGYIGGFNGRHGVREALRMMRKIHADPVERLNGMLGVTVGLTRCLILDCELPGQAYHFAVTGS
jgi:hypothetical protein